MSLVTRRKVIGSLAGAALLYPLISRCNRKLFINDEMILSVVLFSNVNRPIFDVLLNGIDIGGANAYGGGGGILTGVTIPFGAQKLTWRLDGPEGMPGNGETVVVKNSLFINEDQVPPKSRYIGVHIYPDDTAELTFSQYIPERSIRGEEILSQVKKA